MSTPERDAAEQAALAELQGAVDRHHARVARLGKIGGAFAVARTVLWLAAGAVCAVALADGAPADSATRTLWILSVVIALPLSGWHAHTHQHVHVDDPARRRFAVCAEVDPRVFITIALGGIHTLSGGSALAALIGASTTLWVAVVAAAFIVFGSAALAAVVRQQVGASSYPVYGVARGWIREGGRWRRETTAERDGQDET